MSDEAPTVGVMASPEPLPALAMSAYRLLVQQFDRDAQRLGVETLAVLGIDPREKCVIDFRTGTITRPQQATAHE